MSVFGVTIFVGNYRFISGNGRGLLYFLVLNVVSEWNMSVWSRSAPSGSRPPTLTTRSLRCLHDLWLTIPCRPHPRHSLGWVTHILTAQPHLHVGRHNCTLAGVVQLHGGLCGALTRVVQLHWGLYGALTGVVQLHRGLYGALTGVVQLHRGLYGALTGVVQLHRGLNSALAGVI